MSEPALKVTRSDVLLRGLRCACPNCGGRGLLASWFRLAPACRHCGMDLARSHGFYSGTTSIGYVAAILVILLPLCFLVVHDVVSARAAVLIGMFGSAAFIVGIYPVMLCWMVAACHLALPGDLPANGGSGRSGEH
ncbi:MAG: hypothetical protein ACO3ND_03110 [Opitutales bacterium]